MVLPTIFTGTRSRKEKAAVSHESVPRNDHSFAQFLAQFAQTAAAHAAELPFSAAEIAEVAALGVSFRQTLQVVTAKRAEYRAAVIEKESTLAEAESFVRILVKKAQADPKLHAALAASLGIAVRNKGVSRKVEVPEDLRGEVGSGGQTLLTWNNGGNGRGTVFCVEKKGKADDAFVIVGVTSKTKFRDNITPLGERVLYRVKAFRADQNSLYSLTVVMHGG